MAGATNHREVPFPPTGEGDARTTAGRRPRAGPGSRSPACDSTALLLARLAIVLAFVLYALFGILSSNFFFVSSVIIAMLAGSTIERGVRTAHLQRALIDEQRGQLALRSEELGSARREVLEEVRVSRARTVATANLERWKIERNLHDGARQHLVALAVNLRPARNLIDDDPVTGARMLEQLSDGVKETIDERRGRAHGIDPPRLMESGLSVALGAAAERCPPPVAVRAGIGRSPSEVEASVESRLWEEDGTLRSEVTDDGPGFGAAATDGDGQGFFDMQDRLGAVGGRVASGTGPRGGARAGGWVPTSSPALPTVDLRSAGVGR